MSEKKLTYIPLDKLEPHPDNPRKDVGDVSELAESIKESGILQNLTVVPYEDRYRVIIGHRRLAAAKLAGLTEAPCYISDMDYKTQVSTMLAENMQRVDLSLTEQAFGIQLMLDLGENIDFVKKKTGFSDSTIRKRLSVAKLNRTDVLKAEQRGATLEEFVEISKIEDEAERKKLLKVAGSANFKWQLEKVREKIKSDKILNEWMEFLNSFAEKVEAEDKDNFRFLRSISPNSEKFKVPDDVHERRYVYRIEQYSYTWIYLYREITEEDRTQAEVEEEERRSQEQKRQEREDALAAIKEKSFKKIADFILNYNGKDYESMLRFFMSNHAFTYFGKNQRSVISYFNSSGEPTSQDIAVVFKNLIDEKGIAKTTLFYLLERVRGYNDSLFSYYGEYRRDEDILKFYDFIQELGYSLADEERAYLDGTHELYVKDEGER